MRIAGELELNSDVDADGEIELASNRAGNRCLDRKLLWRNAMLLQEDHGGEPHNVFGQQVLTSTGVVLLHDS